MVAGLIAALSLGSIGIAEASTRTAHTISSTMPRVAPLDPDIAVLAQLVTAGTITQAQSTLILTALQAAHATLPQIGGGAGDSDGPEGMEAPEGMKGPEGMNGLGGVNIAKNLVVITTTLGITALQLQADLVAGQSLATIAGAKTAALITALVAAETTEINARVTAGTLTQLQATTMIAGLTVAVTAFVNATPPQGGFGHEGHGKGHGKEHGNGHAMGGMGGLGGGIGLPSITPNAGADD